MGTRDRTLRHVFGGGWATDYGPTAEIGLDPSGLIQIPFLVNADNVLYEFDGGPHKIGGTTKINSTTIESGEQIRGLFDYWKMGTGGSAKQRRLVHAGTKVLKDDADGSFGSIITDLENDTIPAYLTYEDIAIIMSSSINDVPYKYDGTTAAALGTNTPNCAFGCSHRDNRVWMAGDAANPSKVYYSPVLTDGGADGDWTADGGSINVDPDDGDRVTGIASHKDEIWVFKGPYYGSIHRITGSAETGDDAYARHTFIRGLGAVWQNTIFRYRDDLGFVWVDGAVHSLAATAAYGDYNEATLSYPINGWLREHVNHSRLPWASAATDTSRGVVFITLPIDTSTDNNFLLAMDYRFNPVRLSAILDIEAGCVAQVTDASGTKRPGVMIGSNDGFVKRIMQLDRSVDGVTGYNARVTTPYLNYGNPINMKRLERASVGIVPKGGYSMTFGWQRDDNAQQTYSVDQSGGAVLGGSVTSGTATAVVANADPNYVDLTSALHGLTVGAVGTTLVLDGTTNYDGTHQISALPDANSITIDEPFVATETGLSASWYQQQYSNPFVLGTSTLAGSSFVDRFMALEKGGEFRSVQYEMSNSGANQDMEVHSFSATIFQGADSGEN